MVNSYNKKSKDGKYRRIDNGAFVRIGITDKYKGFVPICGEGTMEQARRTANWYSKEGYKIKITGFRGNYLVYRSYEKYPGSKKEIKVLTTNTPKNILRENKNSKRRKYTGEGSELARLFG